MEPDELWAYRETGKHPLVPVRFLRHGRGTNKRNAYCLVRFEDSAADGLESWVPTGRLKCLWPDAEAFRANELRWAGVLEASRDSPGVVIAVDAVILDLLPEGMWSDSSRPGSHSLYEGLYGFRNLEALSELTGIPVDELRGEPSAFQYEEGWVVPLPTAIRVAERLAPLDPATVLRLVEREERQLVEEEEDWRLRNPSSGPGRQWEAEWDERRRSFALRRNWIGEESISLRGQALVAQEESEWLRGLVVWAIKKLAGYGHKSSAETLRRNLDAG